MLGSEAQVAEMHANYLKGGYGYGHAKQALYDLIVERFKAERDLYAHYMNHHNELDQKLKEGAERARVIARSVIKRVREKLGY